MTWNKSYIRMHGNVRAPSHSSEKCGLKTLRPQLNIASFSHTRIFRYMYRIFTFLVGEYVVHTCMYNMCVLAHIEFNAHEVRANEPLDANGVHIIARLSI